MKILRQINFSKKGENKKVRDFFWHQPEILKDADRLEGNGYTWEDNMKASSGRFSKDFINITDKSDKTGNGLGVFYNKKTKQVFIEGLSNKKDEVGRSCAYTYLTDETDPKKIRERLSELSKKHKAEAIIPDDLEGSLTKHKKTIRNKKIAAVGTAAIIGAGAALTAAGIGYKLYKNKKKDSDKK